MSKTKKKTPEASGESQDANPVALRDAEPNVSTNEAPKPYKSKLHAVELALRKLGWDAMPARIHDHLLERFQLDMTPAHIGVNKTSILRRLGKLPAKDKDGRRKVVPAKSTTGKVGRPRKAAAAEESATGASFSAEDIRIVKGLLGSYDQKSVLEVASVVTQVGPNKFRELVEAVG